MATHPVPGPGPAPQYTPDDYRISVAPAPAGYVGYPTRGTHVWGAFAQLAIEAGGYGDLEAIQPHSGQRLNLVGAWHVGGDPSKDTDPSPYAALRRLVDAMEAAQFLGPADPDGGIRPAPKP